MKKTMRAALMALMAVALLTPVQAGGGKTKAEPASPNEEAKTKEQEAVEHYNYGIASRDRAWKLEKKLATANDKARAKTESKIVKSYERARAEFETATQKNSMMFEAHSDLGYCLRKLGNYEGSLDSYDKALSIEPRYSPAIEYRAEAYLALNRLEEAKQAYMQLFGGDREQADKLLAAMRAWVDKNADADFAAWVAEREELATQTQSVSQLKQHDW